MCVCAFENSACCFLTLYLVLRFKIFLLNFLTAFRLRLASNKADLHLKKIHSFNSSSSTALSYKWTRGIGLGLAEAYPM